MPKLRDDFLVSICFSEASAPELAGGCLADMVATLRARYRYWEILVVNEAGHEAEFDETLMAVPNLRYLSVAQGLDDCQRRVVAASEAIGDIVVISSLDEIASIDIPAMIESADETGAVIVGLRRVSVAAEPLIIALGRVSGFRASTRDMKTMALPRTVLNRLLSHPNPVLALRFPPRDAAFAVLRQPMRVDAVKAPYVHRRSSRAFTRIDLVMRMITEAGPSILVIIALLSVLISISAALFAIYVVAVYFIKADTPEGWATISLAISGMLGFLGIALFGISVTLCKIAEMLRSDARDYLIAERSSVDLFESVAHALNVDTGNGDREDRMASPIVNASPRQGREGV